MATKKLQFQVNPQPRTVSWFDSERDSIDRDPVYQRKSHVWSQKDQQFLIDSILNGFDIPKIYLADFTFGVWELQSSSFQYAVIDGKQRITSIFDFFDNRLPLSDSFQFYRDPSLKLGGMIYKELSRDYPKVARLFDNYVLTVIHVVTNDEAKINELFVRLNTSKPLTGAELRNAMLGEAPKLIRDLAAHPFFKADIAFNTQRSQDRALAAKLLLIEHRGAPADTKKTQLDELVAEVRGKDSQARVISDGAFDLLSDTSSVDVDRSALRVRNVLDAMHSIFGARDPLLRQQAQIVLMYWFVRNVEIFDGQRVRSFFQEIEQQRKVNRKAAKEEKHTRPELDRFELLTRNGNDAGSIKQRYRILINWWESYLSTGVIFTPDGSE